MHDYQIVNINLIRSFKELIYDTYFIMLINVQNTLKLFNQFCYQILRFIILSSFNIIFLKVIFIVTILKENYFQ